jgi:hypothetical protein
MLDRATKTEDLQNFKTHLHGELIVPRDATYDSARKVWNGLIDTYLALIAYYAGVSDVLRSIEFARD